jgi:hypothetical protein
VPGRFFKCPNGVGKLSDKACAGLYTEAMSPKGLREGLRFKCRSCPLGAQHAGVKPLAKAAAKFLAGMICARCVRHAPRLIRGVICVSCYNREREMLIGRNAKGNKPVHGREIAPATVHCSSEETSRVKRVDRASSHLEAMLCVMRAESRSLNFGWISRSVIEKGQLCS